MCLYAYMHMSLYAYVPICICAYVCLVVNHRCILQYINAVYKRLRHQVILTNQSPQLISDVI